MPSANSLRPRESGPNWVQLVLWAGSGKTRGHGGAARCSRPEHTGVAPAEGANTSAPAQVSAATRPPISLFPIVLPRPSGAAVAPVPSKANGFIRYIRDPVERLFD